ncbi:hypothetical protein CGJ15_25600 [Vibrio parahaemolyticus]|nr:hypothetical protein CGJ15_25600 [Vibrio parahaemolyticus]
MAPTTIPKPVVQPRIDSNPVAPVAGDADAAGGTTNVISNGEDVATISSTSTTLDPLEEFCREACKEGVGGPECDCPDHPFG